MSIETETSLTQFVFSFINVAGDELFQVELEHPTEKKLYDAVTAERPEYPEGSFRILYGEEVIKN